MTRFSETFHDFAEESVKDEVYKEVNLRMADPYGYWVVDGIDGYYTSFDVACKAIDQMLQTKSLMPKVEPVIAEAPKTTKKIAKKAD